MWTKIYGFFSRCSLFMAIWALSSGCAVLFQPSDGVEADSLSEECEEYTPVVEAVYPNNGANWMDYVKADGTTWYNANDVACNAGSDTSCIHGGPARKIELPVETSCDGVNASDNLDAFSWICDDSSGSVVLYSARLKDDVGLAQLLSVSGWESNKVTITTSECRYETASSAWWSNAIVDVSQAPYLNDNSGGPDPVVSLNTSGTIYVVPADQNTAGYNLDADKVAFVVEDGATLTYNAGVDGSSCNDTTGETAAPNEDCIVSSGTQRFVWVEGDFQGANAGTDRGILLKTVLFSTVRNASVSNVTSFSVSLFDCSYNSIERLHIAESGYGGLWFNSSSTYNRFSRVKVTNARRGLSLSGADYNFFVDLVTVNHADGGGKLRDYYWEYFE